MTIFILWAMGDMFPQLFPALTLRVSSPFCPVQEVTIYGKLICLYQEAVEMPRSMYKKSCNVFLLPL